MIAVLFGGFWFGVVSLVLVLLLRASEIDEGEGRKKMPRPFGTFMEEGGGKRE